MPNETPDSVPTPETTQVFLSFADNRKDLAAFVSKRLRELGIETGDVAHDRQPDEDIQAETKKRLQSAKAMIALVTSDSIDSDWLSYELGLASGLDRRVIPVIVDVDVTKLPPQLSRQRMLKLEELNLIREMLRSQP